MRAVQYFHTVKYLKPIQLYGRLWFSFYKPKADLSPAPALRALSLASFLSPAQRRPSMLGPRKFNFLNEEGTLDSGWDDLTRTKLWRYNLHYFDDLNSIGALSRDAWHKVLIDDWIAQNLPGEGTGWEPYPTSLRIVNWIKRHLDGRYLSTNQCQSLAVQVRWLMKRLEWHLLGNHLFANAKALIFAGFLFDGPEANCWLTKGLNIVRLQLSEQVLADGGNFELSPMYHSIFLEDLLDLINVASLSCGLIDSPTIQCWRETAEKMLNWMAAMCHPDGEISFFNDAAFGVASTPAELKAYASRNGVVTKVPEVAFESDKPVVTVLSDSGYVRMEATAAVALLDVAHVGPAYLPGHAHADTLSFELSIWDQRVVVNGGTSRYGIGPERLRERSTIAHSTVMINNRDSSEVWGGFRVARRARPIDLMISQHTDEVVVACSHDGYQRLPGKPIHRRQWNFGSNVLTVTDKVIGMFTCAEAKYNFHPDVRVYLSDENMLTLALPTGEKILFRVTVGRLRLESSRYACMFGFVQNTTCAVVSTASSENDATACIEFVWK
ncbi:MAG: alginate lyase family protein [Gammaproteobacteria bacterium]|nr:alginate lyase family protein [Gammaproteobacteria bacterium]